MIEVSTQMELRKRQSLDFCYLCGKSLLDVPKKARNMDHVPPSAVFLTSDRNPPLKLPTHCTCNNSQSRQDETIKQLVMMLHDRPHDQNLLPMDIICPEGDPLTPALATTLDFRPIILRWVRGGVSALYYDHNAAP